MSNYEVFEIITAVYVKQLRIPFLDFHTIVFTVYWIVHSQCKNFYLKKMLSSFSQDMSIVKDEVNCQRTETKAAALKSFWDRICFSSKVVGCFSTAVRRQS